MSDFYVSNVWKDYGVFSRKTGATDTIFDAHAEAKTHCDELNYDLQVKSAAHEMLAALKTSLAEKRRQYADARAGMFDRDYTVKTLIAAIAKAEGRS